jgi:hypothetical protein
MANGTLEIEIAEDQPTNGKKRLKKSSIPLHQVQPVLDRINRNSRLISESHLSNLLARNVLILGMEVACSYCDQKTWFTLEQLGVKLKCQRCLREFDFPLTAPHRNTWSYRVQGPFAIEDYAHGAYCVAAALEFLGHSLGKEECTWIPSFKLCSKSGGKVLAEADFGAFIRPSRFSHLTSPVLIFGECKMFGDFDTRDYKRMKALASLFPGAIISFCTLKSVLTNSEKSSLAALARKGRKSLKTGRWQNPVLVLTKSELLGQFKWGSFIEDYPQDFAKR